MNGPKQRIQPPARQDRPSHHGLAVLLGISCLSFLSGCAQLDQLLGKQSNTTEPSPPAQATVPARENRPVQATKPVSKPDATTKAGMSSPPVTAAVPPPQAPSHKPEPAISKSEPSKAPAETSQPKKEKKSRIASKKSKKSTPPHAESTPPTEDDFLSPIPLPSKPAAIGGSGG